MNISHSVPAEHGEYSLQDGIRGPGQSAINMKGNLFLVDELG